jgi:hypothetical protein
MVGSLLAIAAELGNDTVTRTPSRPTLLVECLPAVDVVLHICPCKQNARS